MLNDYRESNSKKRQSHRRTLLCCSTLCLCLFLILFLFVTKVFHYHSIYLEKDRNKSITLNIMRFHRSLIHCGKSVVEGENSYQIIEQLTGLIKNFDINQKNQKVISINEQVDKRFIKEVIVRLEFVLVECFQARQFSIIEQQKPTIIRKIISFLRKEFLYLIGFFINED